MNYFIGGIITGIIGGAFIAMMRAPQEDRLLVIVLTLITSALIAAALLVVLAYPELLAPVNRLVGACDWRPC